MSNKSSSGIKTKSIVEKKAPAKNTSSAIMSYFNTLVLPVVADNRPQMELGRNRAREKKLNSHRYFKH